MEITDDLVKRLRVLGDIEDKNHPRQRGAEAARLVCAVYWARELDDPAMDTRVFKAPQLNHHSLLVGLDKRPSHFWTGYQERFFEISAEPHARRERMFGQGQ